MDPLLGFTGGKDTLQQVKLRFPTLDSAIQYAERQGLRYRVWPAESEANPATRVDAAA
ncbi:NADH dehydrogenase ubiquinone Fe-S protein 4 [Ensifer aridi]|uniref:NADH dehydrogenase ubiquinone Fe-S protein 4 n=1 Tax=Ensifer aridi TaxID=1708715 RepID=UPI003B967759